MAAAEWFYTTNKQEMGPVSWPELHELAEVGILKPHDMVWTEGMDDWVKAINQQGLFTEGAADQPMPAGKKSAYTQPKPPPGRRTGRRQDDEDDDGKEAKKAERKRQEERAKMAMGLKMGLTLGGVLLLLLVGGACIVGMIYVTFLGVAKGDGDPKDRPPRTYTVNSLPPNKFDDNRIKLTKGKRVTIICTNNLADPRINVDLHVYRGEHSAGPNERPVSADGRPPNEDRNCIVGFNVPETDIYRVQVINRGPGNANSCVVIIEER